MSHISDHLDKTNNAKGIYQFEVVKILINSESGVLCREEVIAQILKNPMCQVGASRLRCHRVWDVLEKKQIIKVDKVNDTVKLVGFDNLTDSEKNEIRNLANAGKRNITDFRDGGYKIE